MGGRTLVETPDGQRGEATDGIRRVGQSAVEDAEDFCKIVAFQPISIGCRTRGR